MRFANELQKNINYILRSAISVLLPAAYLWAVSFRLLSGGLSFLQPTVVGTMPLFIQLILLDVLFYFVFSPVNEGGEYRKVLMFIAALLFCGFFVRAGWVVFEAVIISALTNAIAPERSRFMLPLRAAVLILIFSLS